MKSAWTAITFSAGTINDEAHFESTTSTIPSHRRDVNVLYLKTNKKASLFFWGEICYAMCQKEGESHALSQYGSRRVLWAPKPVHRLCGCRYPLQITFGQSICKGGQQHGQGITILRKTLLFYRKSRTFASKNLTFALLNLIFTSLKYTFMMSEEKRTFDFGWQDEIRWQVKIDSPLRVSSVTQRRGVFF